MNHTTKPCPEGKKHPKKQKGEKMNDIIHCTYRSVTIHFHGARAIRQRVARQREHQGRIGSRQSLQCSKETKHTNVGNGGEYRGRKGEKIVPSRAHFTETVWTEGPKQEKQTSNIISSSRMYALKKVAPAAPVRGDWCFKGMHREQ